MSSPASRRAIQRDQLVHDYRTAFAVALVLWAISLLLLILVAIPETREAVQTVDDALFDLVVWAEWAPAVFLAKVLNVIGSAWVTVPFRIAFAAWLAARRRWEALTFWVFVSLLSEPMIGYLKGLYERPRPPNALVETTGFSFPSGHAIVGAVIAVSLVIVLVPAGPARRNLEMAAVAAALVMALSRVYLRAHWLTDVAAGAALGAAIAIGAAAIMHRIDDRRRGEVHKAHKQ